MTWAEFRQWALERHGCNIPAAGGGGWLSIVFRPGTRHRGSGYDVNYGIEQQRRLAAWLRGRDLFGSKASMNVQVWLAAAQYYDDGWLINTGSGIRWISHDDLLAQAPAIHAKGLPLVGIRCGI